MKSKYAAGVSSDSLTSRRHIASRVAVGIALALGIVMAANGIVMLLIPFAWYKAVPGGMETGPFNQHLVRDIALLYGLIGTAFVVGAFNPRVRLVCWGASAGWLTGHAAFHFWEVASGICGPSAITRDFAAVTLPAVIGVGLSVWAWIPNAAKRLSPFGR